MNDANILINNAWGGVIRKIRITYRETIFLKKS